MNDELKDYLDYCNYLGVRDEATRVIKLVNRFGSNLNNWTKGARQALEATVTNCYWSGMFGETGQKCYRCSQRRRNRIFNGLKCWVQHR